MSLTVPDSCASCDSWAKASDSISWTACNTAKKGVLVPQPAESGGDGYLRIASLNDALTHKPTPWASSTGQCGGSYYGDDNSAGDCASCYNYGTNSENFVQSPVAPWRRASCYLTEGKTWSQQKMYNL